MLAKDIQIHDKGWRGLGRVTFIGGQKGEGAKHCPRDVI